MGKEKDKMKRRIKSFFFPILVNPSEAGILLGGFPRKVKSFAFWEIPPKGGDPSFS
jgi:hypothetical protein